MVSTKKAILIGDYTNPPYHPLCPIDREITEILQGIIALQSTEDYRFFTASKIKDFQLCISYTDCWNQKQVSQYVAGLLSFVSGGGGFLAIHNGISIHGSFELAQLLGGRFTGHPPMQKLEFTISDPDHPVMAGIDRFAINEEPYQFVFDNFSEKTILMEYAYDNQLLPAAWAHRYGMGKVVYLMPGHELEAFKSDIYRQIIRQSVQWLISDQD